MLATCFALLFQSTLINDGLGEYMSFIRGTTTIGIQMYVNNFKILFSKVFGDENMEELDPKLQQAPLIESSVVVSAIRSLERIAPLCQTKVEREMYGLLLSMARNLITSSRDGMFFFFYNPFLSSLSLSPWSQLISSSSKHKTSTDDKKQNSISRASQDLRLILLPHALLRVPGIHGSGKRSVSAPSGAFRSDATGYGAYL